MEMAELGGFRATNKYNVRSAKRVYACVPKCV